MNVLAHILCEQKPSLSMGSLRVDLCNESLTVYSFLVEVFNLGTKNLASLYVRVCKTDRISLNGRQPSTSCICTL